MQRLSVVLHTAVARQTVNELACGESGIKAYSPGVYSEYKDPCEQEAKETTGNMTLTPAQERGQRRRFKAYKELLDQSLSADGGALAFYLLLVWTNYLRLSGQYPSDPRLGSDQAMLRSCLLNSKMDRWPPGIRDELAAHLSIAGLNTSIGGYL